MTKRRWLTFAVLLVSVVPALAQPSQEAGVCHTLTREPALLKVGAMQMPGLSGSLTHFVVRDSEPPVAIDLIRQDDIATQLAAANVLFHKVLGLTPPLQMPRYLQAEEIVVILRDDQVRGGQAYDEVVRNPAISECHIRMALGGRVEAATNLTPAHELFHLYQNAYMMFKQGWVHEGLARWSESLLSGDVQPGPPLPTDSSDLESIMQSSYGAVTLWQRLFYLLDPQGRISLPSSLMSLRYHDGSQVVTLEHLHGSRFVAPLFEALHQASISLAQQQQWPTYGWAEAEQRSLQYNHVILAALYQAILAYAPKEQQLEELRRFMQLIDTMLKERE